MQSRHSKASSRTITIHARSIYSSQWHTGTRCLNSACTPSFLWTLSMHGPRFLGRLHAFSLHSRVAVSKHVSSMLNTKPGNGGKRVIPWGRTQTKAGKKVKETAGSQVRHHPFKVLRTLSTVPFGVLTPTAAGEVGASVQPPGDHRRRESPQTPLHGKPMIWGKDKMYHSIAHLEILVQAMQQPSTVLLQVRLPFLTRRVHRAPSWHIQVHPQHRTRDRCPRMPERGSLMVRRLSRSF